MSENLRKILAAIATIALAVIVIVGMIVGGDSQTDRARSLGARIKCPVCQGEAILDSPSETARAMMGIVEERVGTGQTDAQIIDYFTERYGDGILLDPRFEAATLLLWLLPAAALAGGVVMILGRRRRPAREGREVDA